MSDKIVLITGITSQDGAFIERAFSIVRRTIRWRGGASTRGLARN